MQYFFGGGSLSVLTEDDVRRMMKHNEVMPKGSLSVSNKTIITPSARAYLFENNITLDISEVQEVENKMMKPESLHDMDSVSTKKDAPVLYDTLFGAVLTEKPEHMTHLRGNVLVFKNHPRIAFRGAIDSLESNIIMGQILAEKEKMPVLISDLEEIIVFIRKLIRCEVSGEPVGEFKLQNLTAEELRQHSHHPSQYYGLKHFLPTYKHGEVVAMLNKLRTLTRETELIAYKAFSNEYGQTDREDIIKSLNRLSSLFWVMMFKYLTEKYK